MAVLKDFKLIFFFQADILFSEAASLEGITFALSSSAYSHSLFHRIQFFKSKERQTVLISGKVRYFGKYLRFLKLPII